MPGIGSAGGDAGGVCLLAVLPLCRSVWLWKLFFAMSKIVCTFAADMEQNKPINWKAVLTVAIAILSAILGAIGENATNCIGTILNH